MSQKWSHDTQNLFNIYNMTSGNFTTELRNSHSSSITEPQVHDNEQVTLPKQNSFGITEKYVVKNSYSSGAHCHITQNSCPSVEALHNSNHQLTGKANMNQGEVQGIENQALCFICSHSLANEDNSISVKESMKHSHAPLLVLLMDVLGYKLDGTSIHAQFLCKACYHLLDTIDDLQQTLTESKTILRTKFLDTIQTLKVKYPRTDKMLKPRCLRCIQMGHPSARRKKMRIGRKTPKSKGSEEDNPGKNEMKGSLINHETYSGEDEEDIISATCQEETPEPNLQSHDDTDGRGNSENAESINQRGVDAANLVFDTDPAFFSPDEKLKAGVLKEEDNARVYTCFYCPSKYDNSLSLKMHVRVFHMPVIMYDNGQGTMETRYRMGIKLQNTSPSDCMKTRKPYACLFCVSSYKLQGSLQFHFRENHSPHKPFQCGECKERFRKTIELSRHRVYRCPMKKNQNVDSKR